MRRKYPKNGWVKTTRIDPETKQRRMIKILMKNGQEIEHHWIDKRRTLSTRKISDISTDIDMKYDEIEDIINGNKHADIQKIYNLFNDINNNIIEVNNRNKEKNGLFTKELNQILMSSTEAKNILRNNAQYLKRYESATEIFKGNDSAKQQFLKDINKIQQNLSIMEKFEKL